MTESLHPGDDHELGRREAELATGVTDRLEQAKGDEADDHLGMQSAGSCELLEVKDGSESEGGGHEVARGLNEEAAASSSKRRRSSSLADFGTMIRTSA